MADSEAENSIGKAAEGRKLIHRYLREGYELTEDDDLNRVVPILVADRPQETGIDVWYWEPTP